MKKTLALLLALTLVLALAASAYAYTVLYAVADNVKVYAEPNTSSAVVQKLSRGQEVLIEDHIEGWYAKLVPGEGGVGQTYGWIQAKDLSTTPPCNHSWTDWVITKNPTCTSKGEKSRVCYFCNEKQTQAIDKLSHSYGDWVVTREPSCTAVGQRARWCSVCGYEQTKEIDKLPHNYGEWTVVTEATENSAGVRTHSCLDCGHVQNKSFDPEGTLRRGDKGPAVREIQQLLVDQGYLSEKKADGSFGAGTEKAVVAFQKDQGLTPDGVAWPETIRRLHHEFGDWEIVTELDRFHDQESVRVCTECGYTERRIVASTPFYVRKDKGDGIKTVQKLLNDMGYDSGKPDGSYGGMLERAWESFALEHDITPQLDKLRPGDLDTLMNEWLATRPEGIWQGQGSSASPVNLILSMSLVREDNGVSYYNWTLSNLGPTKCRFVTLLFANGKDHDFSGDDMVAFFDRQNVKANGGNRLNGSFSIAGDWTDAVSFCAVAIEEETGTVWTSNVVNFGQNA